METVDQISHSAIIDGPAAVAVTVCDTDSGYLEQKALPDAAALVVLVCGVPSEGFLADMRAMPLSN